MTSVLILNFENDDDRNWFLGQLLDGFGENFIDLDAVDMWGIKSDHNFDVTITRDPYGFEDEIEFIGVNGGYVPLSVYHFSGKQINGDKFPVNWMNHDDLRE